MAEHVQTPTPADTGQQDQLAAMLYLGEAEAQGLDLEAIVWPPPKTVRAEYRRRAVTVLELLAGITDRPAAGPAPQLAQLPAWEDLGPDERAAIRGQLFDPGALLE